MKYMGSKARIANNILPIILKERKQGQYYVEPFCGGCNVIDKAGGNRIASDNNQYLISMFKSLQEGWIPPEEISREHYNEVRRNYNQKGECYTDSYTGFVGFVGSYNGRFFDGGYSGKVKIKNGSTRDYITEARTNLMVQIESLSGVTFICRDYKDSILPSCSLIYCDPPYLGVKKYSYQINHVEFWQWCRDMAFKGHKVFISEYNAPEDFACIWQQEIKTAINQTITKNVVEKLFVHKSQLI
jgi:DNA adenine methylase